MHQTPLITLLVAGLGLAFVFGALAHRLKVPAIVGYLLAGVAVGPFTPGFVGDPELATQLAEIGVILLMFGVGLHFSLKDLLSVKAIALPGAVAQIAVATLLGMGLAHALGWEPFGGFVFGLSLSVASTVVLLRALGERRLIETERGRIAVGWLIVEDLAMVLALVLIPAIAGLSDPGAAATAGSAAEPTAQTAIETAREVGQAAAAGDSLNLFWSLAVTLGKVAAFVALMLVAGRRLLPWMLHWVAHTGSRELFRLAVLAVALGVAYGAVALFDVSFALGAFFAGMILGESPLSQQSAQETLPLRDAFAVLFFVSVGMLFDPSIVVRAPLELAATLGIILFGKSIAAFALVRAFGRSTATALTISASLAQIGEFSFILAGLGVALGVMPEAAHDLVLAGAILSIVVNPLLFRLVDRLVPAAAGDGEARRKAADAAPRPEAAAGGDIDLSGHSVVIGYGRVGVLLVAGLAERGEPILVIDDRADPLAAAKAGGIATLTGNGADPRVIEAAGVERAVRLLVAIPESFEAGQAVLQARRRNPRLVIIARAHSAAAAAHLATCGADKAILAEHELAKAMLVAAATASRDAGTAQP